MVGSPWTALGLTAGLVARTGIPSISLDYRLAPEHPFPADVQDVVAAYRELLEQGHAPGTIALAGDSAGGGLTIAGALAARDAGLPRPAAIVAFSPGLDATRTGQSMVTKADADPLLDRASLDRLSNFYVAGQERSRRAVHRENFQPVPGGWLLGRGQDPQAGGAQLLMKLTGAAVEEPALGS